MDGIEKLDLGLLYVEEAFGFHQLVDAEISKCLHPQLTAVYNVYHFKLQNWEDTLQSVVIYPSAAEVKAFEVARTEAWQGIYHLVKVFKKHFDPAKALVGKQLDYILQRYGGVCSMSMLKKNGKLHHLIEDLEFFDLGGDPLLPHSSENQPTPENAGRLGLLGLREWLDRLKDMHNQYMVAFTARNEALGEQLPTGTGRAARLATEKAYRDVVRRINALIEIEGTDAFLDMLHSLNTLIDRQKALLAARITLRAKRRKKKEDAEKEPAPGEPLTAVRSEQHGIAPVNPGKEEGGKDKEDEGKDVVGL